MLPSTKTRSGRTTYGEFVVLNGGPSTVTLGTPNSNSLRYTPYQMPASVSGIQHHHQQQHLHHHTTHIIPFAPSILQYSNPSQANLYDASALLSYKRLLAANASATLRSHNIHQLSTNQASSTPRTASTFSYPLNELLGLQALDAFVLPRF